VIGRTSEQGDWYEYSGVSLTNDPVMVKLDNFWIAQTEVTQELWEAVMGENPSKIKDNPKLPVTNVSWDQCMVFITRLNGLTGEQFRMPTEAEWEYAARGGMYSNYYKYSGSNNCEEVGWIKSNSYEQTASDSSETIMDRDRRLAKLPAPIHIVATKKPNELGLYDMSGNVWEWCKNGCDNSGGYLQGGNNPQGGYRGADRILRGGSCKFSTVGICMRYHSAHEYGSDQFGLRLARSVKIKVVEED